MTRRKGSFLVWFGALTITYFWALEIVTDGDPNLLESLGLLLISWIAAELAEKAYFKIFEED